MSLGPGGAGRRRRVITALIGGAAVLVGVALTFRPFTSLDALTLYIGASLLLSGAGELFTARGDASPGDRAVGALLVVTGLIAALAPNLTVSATAIVVGIGMVLSGAARLIAGWRHATDERYSAIVGGLATAVFGVLALAWPDVTILVIALLVGPVAIIFGARQLVRAVRGPRPAPERQRGRVRLWLRGAWATAGLLFALLLVLISALVNRASPTVPPFYSWSGPLPSRPGVLLREEPAANGVPAGSRAVRILYTTTGLHGTIVPASGLVVASAAAADAHRPLPVLLWEHGTTGVAQNCAPSLLPNPFTAGALFVADQILARGWALVAPDYLGLGASPPHPYLVGVPEARSALDAVRAARGLPTFTLGPKTVVWGHSQGGGAALWTGIEAHRYAPDVPLSGVAALAPASDLVPLANGLETSPAGMLFATFIVSGYSSAYPDVSFDDYVRPSAQEVVRQVSRRCLGEPATLLSLPAVLTGEPIFSRPLTTGALGTRLAQNAPDQPTGLPMLIAQGGQDRLVLPAVQRRFAARLCAAGQRLEFRAYPTLDHVPLVEVDSPLIPYLLSWTADRFRGAAAPDNCATVR